MDFLTADKLPGQARKGPARESGERTGNMAKVKLKHIINPKTGYGNIIEVDEAVAVEWLRDFPDDYERVAEEKERKVEAPPKNRMRKKPGGNREATG